MSKEIDVDYFLGWGEGVYDVVVANGLLPTCEALIKKMRGGRCCVACDGAVHRAEDSGVRVDYVIGDGDSVDKEKIKGLGVKVIEVKEQESNDLSKAIKFIKEEKKSRRLLIFGATGLREDHAIGNIGILAQHGEHFEAIGMVSDYGIFNVMGSGDYFLNTYIGQQVSLFGYEREAKVWTEGLKWELQGASFGEWNLGTLNMALTPKIKVSVREGRFIIYRGF